MFARRLRPRLCQSQNMRCPQTAFPRMAQFASSREVVEAGTPEATSPLSNPDDPLPTALDNLKKSPPRPSSARREFPNPPFLGRPNKEYAKAKPSKFYSRIPDIYKVGEKIPHGETTSDRLTESGIPMWGEWGVPLKFLTWGGFDTIMMPNFWLRDNCRCSKCVNQDTMQKAFDTFSISRDILPEEVKTVKEGLRIIWSGSDKHESLYSWEWLMKQASRTKADDDGNMVPQKRRKRTSWGAGITGNPPSVEYNDIMDNDTSVGLWTEKIRLFGFCYVNGCPVDPEKTKELLERIAFIRETHYGGFYDFTSDLTMKDTAYTSLALGAHTDTAYFTEPAGLQMFHLLSHTEGEGGKSLLVDGLRAVRVLLKEDPMAAEILARKTISWHASGNEGITIVPSLRFPILEFNKIFKKGQSNGRINHFHRIRWNNDDRAPVDLKGNDAGLWYDAARKLDEILKRKDMEYWAQLEPGRPLIFDNWRVLHGRSAFTGKRRICGGYINHDDYISRWRNTNFTRAEALSQIL